MPEQTDTDTIYILSENAPTQIDNMVGLADQINLPPEYSRIRPEPTATQGVWRVQRTRRFNVEPLALSQADILYDKTTATTVTLAQATGGEIPVTYSAPLVRGSQSRYDVPGAPVTFDPATRELNIGSGFDEGLEINYTARDACNQVANARVIVRPSGGEHDDFASSTTSVINLDGYALGIGSGQVDNVNVSLPALRLGIAPYAFSFQTPRWADEGWTLASARDSATPEDVTLEVTYGDWFLSQDGTIRLIDMVMTDFLGRTRTIRAAIAYN